MKYKVTTANDLCNKLEEELGERLEISVTLYRYKDITEIRTWYHDQIKGGCVGFTTPLKDGEVSWPSFVRRIRSLQKRYQKYRVALEKHNQKMDKIIESNRRFVEKLNLTPNISVAQNYRGPKTFNVVLSGVSRKEVRQLVKMMKGKTGK